MQPHFPDEAMEARKRTSPQSVAEPLTAASSCAVPNVAEGEAMLAEMPGSPSSAAPRPPTVLEVRGWDAPRGGYLPSPTLSCSVPLEYNKSGLSQ